MMKYRQACARDAKLQQQAASCSRQSLAPRISLEESAVVCAASVTQLHLLLMPLMQGSERRLLPLLRC